MATKYLDHGAYLFNNCSFTGNIFSNSGQIVVTAMAPGSDPILPGMHVMCNRATFPATAYVNSQNSSTEPDGKLGGRGTYTVNLSNPTGQAANNVAFTGVGGHLNNTATTLYNDVDYWGKPQCGDGLTKEKSTEASTLEIDFTNITCPVGGVINFGGAILTAISGAVGSTANVFSLGGTSASGATLVANIIASFYRTLFNNNMNPPAEGWAAIRAHMALILRQKPGSPAVMQVQTRIGSPVYANNDLVAISLAGMTGAGVGGPYKFIGGKSGCMGVFQAMFDYGATNEFGLATSYYEGSLLGGDIVEVRSHRRYPSGKQLGVLDTTCHLGFNRVTVSPGFPNVGTKDNPVVVRFDDGTVWPEDTAGGTFEPKFRLFTRHNSSTAFYGFGGGTSNMVLQAKRYGNKDSNAILEAWGTTAGVTQVSMRVIMGSNIQFKNMDFFGTEYGWIDIRHSSVSSALGASGVGQGCRLINDNEKSGYPLLSPGSTTQRADLYDCEIGLRNPSNPQNVVISGMGNSSIVAGRLYLEGVRFTGFRDGSQLFGPANGSGGDLAVVLRNCDYGNINKIGPSLTSSTQPRLGTEFGAYGHFSSSSYGDQEYFSDTVTGYVGWIVKQDQPCLNARLLNGKPWSLRMVPSTQADQIHLSHTLDTPRLGKYNGSTQSKKRITLRLLVEKSWALTTKDLSMVVTYMDAETGKPRTFTTHELIEPVPLPFSASEWVRASNAQASAMQLNEGVVRASFNDTDIGTVFLDPRKLEFVTPTEVMPFTEISAVVKLHVIASGSGQQIFVDPDYTLEDVA